MELRFANLLRAAATPPPAAKDADFPVEDGVAVSFGGAKLNSGLSAATAAAAAPSSWL